MDPTPDQLKAVLREHLRSHAATVSPADRAAASAELCERLADTDFFRRARAILFFAPLGDEPDIWPLLEGTTDRNVTTALPRFDPATKQYEAAIVRDLDRDLVPGRFGIREPAATCPVLPWNLLDLVLVPGLGFTIDGKRLGRGKGFYDRLLPLANGVKCGLAFDWQVVAEIPVAPHDINLNCILTPTRRLP